MRYEPRSKLFNRDGERSPSVLAPWSHGSLVGGPALTMPDRIAIEERATEESSVTASPASRYRSILVPVDGTPFGEHALPLALGIARRAGAEVRVLHVHCPMVSTISDMPYSVSGSDTWLKRRQEKYLEDLVRRLAKVSSVPIVPSFREGRDVADSLQEAASVGTDLVVMATHGRGAFGRFWFGSISDELVRRLSVPLRFVRGYNAPADLMGDPALRHVLIPLDGSEGAEKVLPPALGLGALTAAEHTLLRVIPWETRLSLGSPSTAGPYSRALQERTEAWDYLRDVAHRFDDEAFRLYPRLVLDEGSTVHSILRQAEAHDADLIAVATRGRRGLSRLFRGSVADRILRAVSVPVLVCRRDEATEEVAS